jgi:hypothetical protein
MFKFRRSKLRKPTPVVENQERRRPDHEFDFMVAGVNFEGRRHLIERFLNAGDPVRIVPAPGKPHDRCAVAVTLADGRQIGSVPRTDSADVSACIENGGYYVATVKKILTEGHDPIPVIALQFYRTDQRADIVHLKPVPCEVVTPGRRLLGYLNRLTFGLASPLIARIPAVRRLASRLGRASYAAAVSLFRWLATVKDDLRGAPDRAVNPASLAAKLLVIVALVSLVLILLFRLISPGL